MVYCKELTHLLGGSISVKSEIGRGSSFKVELPVDICAEKSKSGNNSEKPKLSAPSSMRKLKILLAEDNQINQKLATVFLNKMGHTVDVASNGKEAVDMFNKNQYDVILMDIEMPVMDGIEASAEIINSDLYKNKKTPIYALSAHCTDDIKNKCRATGIDDFIEKPIDVALLTQKLSAVY